MKYLILPYFLLNLMSTYAAENVVNGVYDKDNRVQANLYKNNYFSFLSKSVAAFIDNENIEMLYFDQLAKITGLDYGTQYQMCEGERFSENIVTSHCSGFLVAPDILITAGHCVEEMYDCTQSKWVFDYEFSRVQQKRSFHTYGSNIYTCVEILAQEYSLTDKDYAVLRLDRKVKDRLPLKLRQSGRIKNNTSLVMSGHPKGLPKVITDGGKVISNDLKNFFVSNIDAFQGNSGGPVFNAGTGLVEGVLVRGGEDFFYDFESDCYKTFQCELHGECPGEDVMRITSIPFLPAKLEIPRNLSIE